MACFPAADAPKVGPSHLKSVHTASDVGVQAEDSAEALGIKLNAVHARLHLARDSWRTR
ncbi:MAG TPA: hypothetical protein VF881_10010 [Polyangiaceae bacterium]